MRWPERIWRDAIYSVRTLRREPIFALAALVTLTLGAVTTITVFSVADAELWRPLPFPEPDRLVGVRSFKPGATPRPEYVSGADFADWRGGSRLAEYAAVESTARRVLQIDRAESVRVRSATTDFFRVLRITPQLGRGFDVADASTGRAIVLTDAGWRRLFDADPNVVGRSVLLDGEGATIVGVTAGARLEFITEPDLFVALGETTPSFRDRLARNLDVYARLQPGVTIGQAQAELQTINARIAADVPDDHAGHFVQLGDLQSLETGFNWRELYFFLGAASLLMVLSCLNVANLLLARALRRRREFAIRAALGGGRAALVRQLFVEGAVLAVPAAAAGTLASVWILRLFTSRIPADFLERGGVIPIDWRVAVFVLSLSLACSLLLSLTPLLFAQRVELNMMLGHGARTAGRTPRQRRIRTLLLAGQVATSLVLLAAAGLFVLSFVHLTETPLGFDPADRLALRVALPPSRYGTDAQIVDYGNRLLDRVRSTAGVRAAVAGSGSPLDDRGGLAVSVVVPGRPRPPQGQEPTALIRSAGPGYFRTLGIHFIAGREFTASDAAGAPRVAIVNELLVRNLFPGENVIGRQLEVVPRFRTGWTARPGLVTIVGVAANLKNFALNEVEFNNLYLPFAQAPAPTVELVVASAVPFSTVVDPLRRAAASIDPSLPVTSLAALTDRADAAMQGPRFNLTLIGVFAAAAVLLAGIGIFGSMACAVQERLREFGVRLALGATPSNILSSALSEPVRIGLAGTAVGVGLSLTIAKVIGSALYLVPGKHGGLLFGVTTTNPVAIAGAALAVLVVATLSGLGPARHATRVDPTVILREE